MSAFFISYSIFLTLLLGLHDLKYKANILHRDVSVNNIMYEVRDGGEPFFILNDFDLVSLDKSDDEEAKPSSKHRTETLPFMPCEVLDDLEKVNREGSPVIPHILRFDFESLYWVSLWCTMAMEPVRDPVLKQAIKTTLSEWETGSFKQIASLKRNLIRKPALVKTLPMTPLYMPCRKWLLSWTALLFRADMQLSTCELQVEQGLDVDPIDLETIDGIITKESMLKAIE